MSHDHISVYAWILALCFWCPPMFASTGCGEPTAAAGARDMMSMLDAAKRGDVEAQTNLGAALLAGDGIERNEEQGIFWLERAAANDSSAARDALGGYYYEKADKGDHDYSRAIEQWERGAAQGNSFAQLHLANIYYKGKGVRRDLTKALELFTKAAQSGNTVAQLWFGVTLAKDGGSAQQREAGVEWVKRAAESGNCAAPVILASLYLEGAATERNPEVARKILEDVYAKGGDQAATAAYYLGWMYMEEKVGIKDSKKAIHWLTIAAKANVADAAQRLAQLKKGGAATGEQERIGNEPGRNGVDGQ